MRLKELRQSKGKTQKDMADYLGINRTTYTKYETGDSEPGLDTIKKLAEYYDVTVDYLIGYDDIPYSQKKAAAPSKQPPKNIEDLPLHPSAKVNPPKRKSILKDEDSIMFAAHSDDDEDPMDDDAHEELKLIIEDVLREHGIIKDKKKK